MVALNYNKTPWYKRIISANMGYLVEAFNKMKHMLQNTVPGDVLDNPKKSDSRPASRATIYGKRHDIRRLTVLVIVCVCVCVCVYIPIYIYIYIYIHNFRYVRGGRILFIEIPSARIAR